LDVGEHGVLLASDIRLFAALAGRLRNILQRRTNRSR
jgi:hypothetical protein